MGRSKDNSARTDRIGVKLFSEKPDGAPPYCAWAEAALKPPTMSIKAVEEGEGVPPSAE